MTNNLLVIGHRGAMGHEPENTLASFRKALSLGAHAIELDVHLASGRLLVIHDDRLERTTDGRGSLTDQGFPDLRKLDAGRGEKIPTLEEVVAEVAGRALLNIELKGKNTARPVAEFIAAERLKGWPNEIFLVSSFDRTMLAEIRALDPELLIGVLTKGASAADFALAEKLRAQAVHPSLKEADHALVAEARRRNLKVLVHTVNEDKDLQKMVELGVDGVFSDYPDRALKFSARGRPPSGWFCD